MTEQGWLFIDVAFSNHSLIRTAYDSYIHHYMLSLYESYGWF